MCENSEQTDYEITNSDQNLQNLINRVIEDRRLLACVFWLFHFFRGSCFFALAICVLTGATAHAVAVIVDAL